MSAQTVGFRVPLRVANTHDLGDQPAEPSPPGLWAFVEADGSYWSWYPTGSTPPSGATTAAGSGGEWSLTVGPSIGPGGLTAVIRIAIGTAAAQSSVHKIPAGAIVLRAYLDIATPYSAGSTISIGTAANPSLFMATTDSDPQVAALYDALQDTTNAVQDPMLVTVAGGPAAGAGFACVTYVVPLD